MVSPKSTFLIPMFYVFWFEPAVVPPSPTPPSAGSPCTDADRCSPGHGNKETKSERGCTHSCMHAHDNENPELFRRCSIFNLNPFRGISKTIPHEGNFQDDPTLIPSIFPQKRRCSSCFWNATTHIKYSMVLIIFGKQNDLK